MKNKVLPSTVREGKHQFQTKKKGNFFSLPVPLCITGMHLLNDKRLSSSSNPSLLSELCLTTRVMLSWQLQSNTNSQLQEVSQQGLERSILLHWFRPHQTTLTQTILKGNGGNTSWQLHVLCLANILQHKGCYGEKDWTSLHQENYLLQERRDQNTHCLPFSSIKAQETEIYRDLMQHHHLDQELRS